jgi:hypothetical protein
MTYDCPSIDGWNSNKFVLFSYQDLTKWFKNLESSSIFVVLELGEMIMRVLFLYGKKLPEFSTIETSDAETILCDLLLVLLVFSS